MTIADLHANWQRIGDEDCINRGSEWIRSRESLLLFVPSAVIPLERNALINTAHEEMICCTIGDVVGGFACREPGKTPGITAGGSNRAAI